MARKRVTEADLLDFRAKAEELSETLEYKYEKLEKEKKPIEDTEEREKGILVIYHDDVDTDAVRKFVRAAKERGYAAETVHLNSSKGDPSRERVLVWQNLLNQAQEGYQALCGHAESIVVLGTGEASPVATIIAEQYPVEALAIVGAGPAMKPFSGKRDFARLASLAKNNLFSIICPVFTLTPSDCGAFKADSVKLFREATRSDDVEIGEIPDSTVPEMWTKREQELENRLFEFIDRL